MILVNCGCCGVASGYGCAACCSYVRRDALAGVQGTVLYEEERRGDGERFCLTSRSWFGIQIAKILLKILGDYNRHFNGI